MTSNALRSRHSSPRSLALARRRRERVRVRSANRDLAACLALLSGSARPDTARAQTLEPPAPRQGYYLSVGFHYGTINTWEDDEALGTWFNRATTIRLGQMLTRRLGLGLQIFTGSAAKGEEYGSTLGPGASRGRWR